MALTYADFIAIQGGFPELATDSDDQQDKISAILWRVENLLIPNVGIWGANIDYVRLLYAAHIYKVTRGRDVHGGDGVGQIAKLETQRGDDVTFHKLEVPADKTWLSTTTYGNQIVMLYNANLSCLTGFVA